MASGHEYSACDTLIYTKLSADTALLALVGTRIYAGLAPEGTAFPCVVYDAQQGVDRTAIGAIRIFSRPLYYVRAITKEDTFVVGGQIADRIDAILMGMQGTVTGAGLYISGCYREQPMRLVEVDGDGVRYNHVGGLYRLFVQKA